MTMRALGPDFSAGEHDDLVGNVDLSPTLAAIAGAELTKPDGFDIRRNQRRAMLLENFGALTQATVEEEPRAEGRLDMESANSGGGAKANWREIRTADAICIETEIDEGGVFRELYDLRDDPYELENRAESDPRAASYRAALKELKHCSGSACNSVNVSR